MGKRAISLAVLVIMTAMLLSGCVYSNVVVNVNADGSGTGVAELGFSKEILDHLGKTMNDFTSKKNENHITKANGREYIAETYADAFTTPETIHWSSGVSMITEEIGPVRLYTRPDGVSLLVALFDEYGPNMKAEHVVDFGNIDSITDETLAGMTLPDLIAQDAPGLSLKVKFNMPYEVKQVGGGSKGVTVNGKTITLDYVKMIKSGDNEWGFDSLKTYSKQQTQPVPSQSVEPEKTDAPKTEPKSTSQPVEPVMSESKLVQESTEELDTSPEDKASSNSAQSASSFEVSSSQQEDSSMPDPRVADTVGSNADESEAGINYVLIGVITVAAFAAISVFVYIKRKKGGK